jgi:hypothetical protein
MHRQRMPSRLYPASDKGIGPRSSPPLSWSRSVPISPQAPIPQGVGTIINTPGFCSQPESREEERPRASKMLAGRRRRGRRCTRGARTSAQKFKSDDPLGGYMPLSMSDGVGANRLPAPNGSCAREAKAPSEGAARVHADLLTDLQAKRMMLEIAESYEGLARRATERQLSNGRM